MFSQQKKTYDNFKIAMSYIGYSKKKIDYLNIGIGCKCLNTKNNLNCVVIGSNHSMGNMAALVMA